MDPFDNSATAYTRFFISAELLQQRQCPLAKVSAPHPIAKHELLDTPNPPHKNNKNSCPNFQSASGLDIRSGGGVRNPLRSWRGGGRDTHLKGRLAKTRREALEKFWDPFSTPPNRVLDDFFG